MLHLLVNRLDVAFERVGRGGHIGALITGVLDPLVGGLLVAAQRSA